MGAGPKIKSTDRPADLAEFGADPQNPFPNGRRATPQASRREAQATREAYRESARPFAPVHSRIRRDETANCVFRNSKHAQKLPSLNFFLFIGTAHDRTPERVVANLSQPAHENKTILTPLRAVRNSIVTSVRSLERPAQNPKFARNLTRPTHFGICATQQLNRPSRISPLQPPSGMDDQMRSHHTALSLSYVKNFNYKIQYFYLAQYKTACSRVEQDRASSVHAGPADARGAGLRLPLRSCREPRKVAKADFRSFREGLRRS